MSLIRYITVAPLARLFSLKITYQTFNASVSGMKAGERRLDMGLKRPMVVHTVIILATVHRSANSQCFMHYEVNLPAAGQFQVMKFPYDS